MSHFLRAAWKVSFIAVTSSALLFESSATAQCDPAIKVDDKITVLNSNLHFPFWLHSGQTLGIASIVQSISVIEFTETGTALEYGQVLSITSNTPVAVPEGKVWKVEAALEAKNSSTYKSTNYPNPGTFTFVVPGCAEQICIEAWVPVVEVVEDITGTLHHGNMPLVEAVGVAPMVPNVSLLLQAIPIRSQLALAEMEEIIFLDQAELRELVSQAVVPVWEPFS